MGDVRATGLVGVRKLIKSKGEETEKAFLARLTPEEQKRHEMVTNVTRMPIEEEVKFAKIAASVLFPQLTLKQGLAELGRAGVKEDMNGALKIFLRFLNPETVFKQTAKLWTNIHSQGRAQVIREDSQHSNKATVEFFIEDYPDMPIEFLYILDGYIEDIVNLTGAKNLQITHNFANKDRWSWKIKWDK